MLFIKNNYAWPGLAVYLAAVLYLHVAFQLPFSDFLLSFIILGVGFSYIGWALTKSLLPPFHKASFKGEGWILFILIACIVFYTTYGGNLINRLLPVAWIGDPQVNAVIVFTRKLIFFVLLPFAVYSIFGFGLNDFGLKRPSLQTFSTQAVIIFMLLAAGSVLFQFFFSGGGKAFRQEHFTTVQLLTGLPLCFIYLLFDAGLIEEFFFRGLLQARLSVLLKSTTGGIVLSALIFGLVHAPGLYLRGAESEGISEQMPFLFWAAYTVTYMSIAGVFFGVVYSKTKNLWLVMAIHAVVDLVPNFTEFIHTWKIK